eukprot:GHVO01054017.1.p3 GENE.GHVO01054017.1~~GHVO01054017.1.p3  ORF type:complete len:125 (+),score=10.37 GHVO01054017.1:106-480(+)
MAWSTRAPPGIASSKKSAFWWRYRSPPTHCRIAFHPYPPIQAILGIALCRPFRRPPSDLDNSIPLLLTVGPQALIQQHSRCGGCREWQLSHTLFSVFFVFWGVHTNTFIKNGVSLSLATIQTPS